MPDTRPITDSFPWLTKRYRAVFDNRNIVGGGSALNAAFQADAFQHDPAFQTGGSSQSLGDLYRYI